MRGLTGQILFSGYIKKKCTVKACLTEDKSHDRKLVASTIFLNKDKYEKCKCSITFSTVPTRNEFFTTAEDVIARQQTDTPLKQPKSNN